MTLTPTLAVCVVASLFTFGCAGPRPPSFAGGGGSGAVSEDGLRLLENGRFQLAWARPGVSFEGYTGVWAAFSGIPYRRDPRDVRGFAQWSNYPISGELRDSLMRVLEQSFREEIAAADAWQTADARGPGVLLARVSLVDLVLNTSLRHLGGDDLVWVDSVGQFTLVIDLYDSETGELLARAAERASIEPTSNRPMRAVAGATVYESKRIFGEWAKKLTSLLDGARVADLSSQPPAS